MDWWKLRELRAAVLTDLANFVPVDLFENKGDIVEFSPAIPNHKHFSREMIWAQRAGQLGRRLFFESTAPMTARQVSASAVLMNLGLLAGAETAHAVTKQIVKDASARNTSSGNAAEVAHQLETEHLPVLSQNLFHSLSQYVRHLDPREAAPFTPLLEGAGSVEQSSPTEVLAAMSKTSGAINIGNLNLSVAGSVGAVQTGNNPVAILQQTVNTGASDALIEALFNLRTAANDSSDINDVVRQEVADAIASSEAELKSGTPDHGRLKQWLGHISTLISTVASLGPAYDAVKIAALALGVQL